MRVGVGYSENPDTMMGGIQAATAAIKEGGQSQPCDLGLLFATARHDPQLLREAVASVVGPSVPVVGGAAAGAISNQQFGYAGDQIILAAFWLEGVKFKVQSEGGADRRGRRNRPAAGP